MMHDPKSFRAPDTATTANIPVAIADAICMIGGQADDISSLLEAIADQLEDISKWARGMGKGEHLAGRADSTWRLVWLAHRESAAIRVKCAEMV